MEEKTAKELIEEGKWANCRNELEVIFAMTQTADEFIAALYKSIDWRNFRNRFNVELYRAYCEKDARQSEGATKQDIDDNFFTNYLKATEEMANGYALTRTRIRG